MQLAIIGIIFFALFIQGVAGFGSALIAMPLLVPLLGIEVAAPMFALLIFTGEIIMIIRYRESLHFGQIWRLMVGALVGIPLGMIGVNALPEPLVLLILGIVTAGYGLYALSGAKLPLQKRKNSNIGYGFGFLAGILSGAYNTGGPPYVMYSSTRGWSPAEFKSNLQAMFFVSSIGVIIGHTLLHHMTLNVIQNFLLALPAMVVGLVLGYSLDNLIKPQQFRIIVLILLVIIGVRLVYVAITGMMS